MSRRTAVGSQFSSPNLFCAPNFNFLVRHSRAHERTPANVRIATHSGSLKGMVAHKRNFKLPRSEPDVRCYLPTWFLNSMRLETLTNDDTIWLSTKKRALVHCQSRDSRTSYSCRSIMIDVLSSSAFGSTDHHIRTSPF